MSSAIVDASFLIALWYPQDRYHQRATAFVRNTEINLLLPTVVLPEVMYNIRRLGGYDAASALGDELIKQPIPFITLTMLDFARAVQVMHDYRDIYLDFVDCCITASAERLKITQVCTFDRRDFSIIRPEHVSYFSLLP